jgi:hypothetical protein
MPRTLKRFLAISGIFIVSLLLLAAAIGFFFEEAIGRQVLRAVNSQLKNEIRVDRVSLSLIRSFPNAALTLEGLELDATDGQRLLDAKRLSFRLGLLSLFGTTTHIHSIVVRDGQLNVRIDAKGKPNYDVFVDTETSNQEENSSLRIDLREARLLQIGVDYDDRSSKLRVLGHLVDASFSGAFSSRQFDLSSKANIDLYYVEADGQFFLPRQKLRYQAGIAVDTDEERYTIRQLNLQLGDNQFDLEGFLDQEPGFMEIDLNAQASKATLEGVLAMLPVEYIKGLEQIQSKGDFYVDARVKGRYNKRSNPNIEVKFGLRNGQLRSKLGGEAIKEVSFEGRYSNGKSQNASTSWLEIPELKGFFQRQYVEMRLRINRFDRPDIDFFLDGALPMDAVYGFLGNPAITEGRGKIAFERLRLKGAYQDMRNPTRADRVELGGRLVFDKVALRVHGELLEIPSGFLGLSTGELRLGEVQVLAPGTALRLNATCSNPLPLLFADSLNTQRAELRFDADLRAERLDLARLMATLQGEINPNEVTAAEYDSIQTAQMADLANTLSKYRGQFKVQIDHFQYGEIKASAFRGNLILSNNQLSIQGDARAMEGTFKLDGKLLIQAEPQLHAHLIAEKVNVSEFFRQSGNFGQDYLTNQHLSGTLNAKIAIAAFFDKFGNLEMNKLHVLAGMGIENGELKGFELLESFGTFVNVKDLRHIRFTNLENYFEIRRGILQIPAMFIQSNALNLTISGRHNFENEFAYFVKVNAGQVLVNRMKKHDPSLRPVEARQRGVFNLYYKIFGNLDNYDFASSRKEIKEGFERSEREKTVLRAQLEREFGFIELLSEPPAWEDVREYGYEGPGGEVEFLDDME